MDISSACQNYLCAYTGLSSSHPCLAPLSHFSCKAPSESVVSNPSTLTCSGGSREYNPEAGEMEGQLPRHTLQNAVAGISSTGLWLKLRASTAGGTDPIPGWRTKIPGDLAKKKKKKFLFKKKCFCIASQQNLK